MDPNTVNVDSTVGLIVLCVFFTKLDYSKLEIDFPINDFFISFEQNWKKKKGERDKSF